FHDVPITAFIEDGLSAIATKLGSPFMLDSYTAAMCNDSYSRASYAKAMIQLNADVDLRDTIVVSVPKFTESDDDEVEFPNNGISRYMSSTGEGGFCEDDLDFYDGYEAQVYDSPEQMHTFCDQFDIRLLSHVRK
ncbi:hypothetical protein Tco_0787053, partial [Tanacetum coccineum]